MHTVTDSFASWMQDVDRAVARLCGLSAADLPDCCYHDMYDDEMTPSQAARAAIREAHS